MEDRKVSNPVASRRHLSVTHISVEVVVNWAYCVRDVEGAQRSAGWQTERKRSPEQPGPQGNAHKPKTTVRE
jgi:hypothetical protein